MRSIEKVIRFAVYFFRLVTLIKNLEYTACISCRGIRHLLLLLLLLKKRCPGYKTKLNLMVRLQLWKSGECKVNLSNQLWTWEQWQWRGILHSSGLKNWSVTNRCSLMLHPGYHNFFGEGQAYPSANDALRTGLV